MGKLHAVSCYWNPCKYRRMRDNLLRFRDSFAGCPLTIIELSFDGSYEYEDTVHVAGDETLHMLWQKERLLNMLVEHLPSEVSQVAWIDADVQFLDDRWAERCSEHLDRRCRVLQLFQNGHFLDPNHRVSHSQRAAVTASKRDHTVAPGLAWAARRSVFPLIDTHVLGGGDNLMWQAFRGKHRDRDGWWRARMSPGWLQSYLLEGDAMHERVQGQVLASPGDIVHYWHGTKANRKYVERWLTLQLHLFDPRTDLELDTNGLWRWASEKPQMHREVAQYFRGRREDG